MFSKIAIIVLQYISGQHIKKKLRPVKRFSTSSKMNVLLGIANVAENCSSEKIQVGAICMLMLKCNISGNVKQL